MLEGDDLTRAVGVAGLQDIDQALGFIAKAMLAGRADFLFGAGMSRAVGMPSGAELAVALLREVLPDRVRFSDDDLAHLASTAPLESVADAVEAALPEGRTSLNALLTRIFADHTAIPSAAHARFATLVRSGNTLLVRRVFTTNFDTLLEAALGTTAIPVTEETLARYDDSLSSGNIPVVYLHGRVGGKLQLTETSIMNTIELRALRSIFQMRLFEAETFCFVGYSMFDPDLRLVYRQYRDQLDLRDKSDKWTYVVSPIQSAEHYNLHRKIWMTRGGVLIPLGADQFFEMLAAALRQAEETRGVDDLLKEYSWSRQELASRVKRLQDALDLKTDADAYELLRRLANLVAS